MTRFQRLKTFLSKIRFPHVDWSWSWSPVSRWVGRWVLPIFLYGMGFGMLVPIINLQVGWDVYVAGSEDNISEYFKSEQTQCFTEIGQNGIPTSEICVTKSIDTGYYIGHGGFSDISDFLLPIRLIVAILVLIIAYRLTPKPK